VCAEFGRPRLASLLIQHKALVGVGDNDQRTSLHLAAWRGFHDFCKLMIEARADVAAFDVDHQTPLHRGTIMGQDKVLLLRTRAPPPAAPPRPTGSRRWSRSWWPATRPSTPQTCRTRPHFTGARSAGTPRSPR
jgi:hypothetical protein